MFDINRKTTVAEVMAWRIHWINCDIEFGILDKAKDAKTKEELMALADALRLVHNKILRLYWEMAKMEGQDNSEYDVPKEINKSPEVTAKYESYCALFNKAVDHISIYYGQLLLVEKREVLSGLNVNSHS